MLEWQIEESAKSQTLINRKTMRIKTILLTMVLIFTLGMALAACGSKSTTQAPAQAPSGNATVAPTTGASIMDGATLLNQRCTRCHTLTRVTTAKHTADQWTQIVSNMVRRGANLNSDEQKALVDYLAKTYGQ
jgi:competence protein ComEA